VLGCCNLSFIVCPALQAGHTAGHGKLLSNHLSPSSLFLYLYFHSCLLHLHVCFMFALLLVHPFVWLFGSQLPKVGHATYLAHHELESKIDDLLPAAICY